MKTQTRNAALRFGVILLVWLVMQHANADDAMPWEGPLKAITNSITGKFAQFLSAVLIVVTGLSIAFGEGGAGMRRLLWLVFGLSITFAATGVFLKLFGSNSAFS
jgi:type IV secretion system protein VirB2